MSNVLKLSLGAFQPSTDIPEKLRRLQVLTDTVEFYIPSFVQALKGKSDQVLIHQDAFAAAHDSDEYLLLGMAIKYAGLYGKTVMIVSDGGTQSLSAEPRI